jgi:hypothetical protein
MAPVRALPVKQGLAHQAKSLPCDLLMARPCRRANQADSDGIRTDVEAQGGMEGVCSWVRAEAPWGHLHGRSTPRGRALFRGRGRTDQAERRQGTVGYRETSLHGATEDQRPFDEVLAPIRTRKAEGEGTEQQVCHRRERFVLGQGKRLGTHGEKRSREGNGRPKGGSERRQGLPHYTSAMLRSQTRSQGPGGLSRGDQKSHRNAQLGRARMGHLPCGEAPRRGRFSLAASILSVAASAQDVEDSLPRMRIGLT